MLKRFLLALAGLLLLAILALAWMLHHPPSLDAYQSLVWEPKEAASGPVKMRFLGVSTVLLDDGETAILTDGFFSRPGRLQSLFGKVEPDVPGIEKGLARAGVQRLAAVIVLHSHYDHAMDAPEVARRTGALLVGSESTANVGRGWRLSERQIVVPKPGEPLRFGRFTVTLLRSSHAPTGFTGGVIAKPLVPPARVGDYKEGENYAVLVQHGNRTLLVNGSAGFSPGALAGVRADVVLLGIGGLGTQSDAYREAYWREMVTATGARRVIPIHWDDFWLPSTGPMQPLPVPLDRFHVSMEFLQRRAAATGVDLRLPLAWEPMDPWQNLP